MRLLMLTWIAPDATGTTGGARVLAGQVAALARRHRLTVATFAGPDPADRAAVERLSDEGVDVHAVWRRPVSGAERWRRRARLLRRWLVENEPLGLLDFHLPAMQGLIDRLAHDVRFDVIQAETAWMAAYRLPPAVPWVLSEHNVAPITERMVLPRSAERLRPIEVARWRRHLTCAWSRADRISAFTQRDAAAIARLVPSAAARLRVNSFGVDLPAHHASLGEADEVLFVGSFGHPPNREAARWLTDEIMPRVWATHPGARLTIVGADPPPELTRNGRVVATGRVERVEPYLERASVVVAPVRTGGGMRVKVLEAMAHGKVVVATHLAAEGLDALGAAPPLIVADAAASIARAIGELLEAPDRRRELGRRARTFVAEHATWGAYARRQEAIYEDLLPIAAAGR